MGLLELDFDRDTWREIRAVRWALAILVLVILAFAKSCSELQRTLWGVAAEAEITFVEPSLYDRNDQRVTLRFNDGDGREYIVKRTLSGVDERFSAGDIVDVVYISRREKGVILAIERSLKWPIILGVLILVGLVWLVNAYRRAEQGKL